MARKGKHDATAKAAEQLLIDMIKFSQEGKSSVSSAKRIVGRLMEMRFRGIEVLIGEAEEDAKGSSWEGPTARELAGGVLAILRHCVDDNDEWHGVQYLGKVDVIASANSDHPPITIRGDGGAILEFQIIVLIRFIGVERLRKCDCGTIFLKVGKRDWCTTRCQKRVYMRGWWKKHPR